MLDVLEDAELRERVRERFRRHLVVVGHGQLEELVGNASNVVRSRVLRLSVCRARALSFAMRLDVSGHGFSKV